MNATRPPDKMMVSLAHSAARSHHYVSRDCGISMTVVTPRACSRIAASIRGDSGVGRVKERHCAGFSPAALERITLNTDKVRQENIIFVAGDVHIELYAYVTLDGDKQPLRCAPKVAKRGITLSLLIFRLRSLLFSNRLILTYFSFNPTDSKQRRTRQNRKREALWRVFRCWI